MLINEWLNSEKGIRKPMVRVGKLAPDFTASAYHIC